MLNRLLIEVSGNTTVDYSLLLEDSDVMQYAKQLLNDYDYDMAERLLTEYVNERF